MSYINACPFNLKEDNIRVLWEITPRCNMNCKHCLFFQNNEKEIQNELSTDQVFNIIDNLSKESHLKAIWLSGGEPLLRKDIVDICKKISDYGIKPSLSTNGILLDKKLADELHSAGVEYIHLSIDGANANTHDKLRGVNGAFLKLMKVMDILKTSPIRVGASFMVTEESIDEIDSVIKIAKSKNLSVISFYLVAELGRGAKNFKNDKIDLAKRLNQKISEIEKNRFNKSKNDLKIEVFRADSCKDNTKGLQECKADKFFNITTDGNLGACPWLMKSDNGFEVGSLLKDDFRILEKKCQDEIKRKIKERREKMSFCGNCAYGETCRRGCMALQLNENNVHYGLDPICPILQKEGEIYAKIAN